MVSMPDVVHFPRFQLNLADEDECNDATDISFSPPRLALIEKVLRFALNSCERHFRGPFGNGVRGRHKLSTRDKLFRELMLGLNDATNSCEMVTISRDSPNNN